MNKINTFVIHYTKLIERKTHIINILKNEFLNVNFITDFDKEEITKSNIKQFYFPNENKFNEKVAPLWDISLHKFRYLTYPEVSCAIKQILAFKEIANSESEYGLILEDDVLLHNNVNLTQDLLTIINKIPSNWDAIFLGEGCGVNFIESKISNSNRIEQNIFKPNHPATNCAEAYLLKKESAKKIYDSIMPFQLAFDWELAYQFYKFNMNVYWVYPCLFYQGSSNGIYNSSIR